MKRDMALRWEQVGEASGPSISGERALGWGAGRTVTTMRTRRDLGWRKEGLCRSRFCERCFFQSCYLRVFCRGSLLLMAAAVEAARGKGVASSPSRQGGKAGVSCRFWNLSVSHHPSPQQAGGERDGMKSKRN